MITKEAIIECIKNPTLSDKLPNEDVRRLITLYPNMEILRAIYLRNLFHSDDISFEEELSRHLLWINNPKWLYRFVTYQKAQEVEGLALNYAANDDYLNMDESQKESLKALAIKLREARLAKLAEDKQSTNAKEATQKQAFSQEEIAKLIKEKKYHKALEILRTAKLDNSKKNAYFALQIQYLETLVKK